jgi:hypothetical protein
MKVVGPICEVVFCAIVCLVAKYSSLQFLGSSLLILDQKNSFGHVRVGHIFS